MLGQFTQQIRRISFPDRRLIVVTSGRILYKKTKLSAQKMNSIPSEKDWNIAENGIDLDTSHAYRMFNGKTHEQAVAMFVEASELYQEDVMWMPLPCFKFYVRSYIEYLNSTEAIGDSDGSNCFFSIVRFRMHEILELDEPTQTMVFDTVEFVGDNQKRFDAESEIYGSFADEAKQLLECRAQHGG